MILILQISRMESSLQYLYGRQYKILSNVVYVNVWYIKIQYLLIMLKGFLMEEKETQTMDKYLIIIATLQLKTK